MTNDTNDPLMQKAAALQANGEQTFGVDNFNAMITAVNQLGVPPDLMRNLVAGPDALKTFTTLGQNALLQQMQNSRGPSDPAFRSADEAYRAIRDTQKSEHKARRR
jgi:hypothetical protein